MKAKNLQFYTVNIPETLNVVLFPVNEQAFYACKLVKREFITQEELFIFQKLGLQIEIVPKTPQGQPCD